MHLSDLASDETYMREIHKISMKSKRVSDGQIVNVDKIIKKAFQAQSDLVMEALSSAAYASYLLGSNPLVHREVQKRELQKRSFVMFKELTATSFLVDSSDKNGGSGPSQKVEKQYFVTA